MYIGGLFWLRNITQKDPTGHLNALFSRFCTGQSICKIHIYDGFFAPVASHAQQSCCFGRVFMKVFLNLNHPGGIQDVQLTKEKPVAFQKLQPLPSPNRWTPATLIPVNSISAAIHKTFNPRTSLQEAHRRG